MAKAVDKSSGLRHADLTNSLSYDPDTGIFRWISPTARSNARPGDVAGGLSRCGYLRIKLFGHTYKAHRLAFFYMTGRWPSEQIDHINLCRTDNRWSNLREATVGQNQANRPTRNRLGIKGVHFEHRNTNRPWVAIHHSSDKSYKYVGSFATPEEAHVAYSKIAGELYGEFAKV